MKENPTPSPGASASTGDIFLKDLRAATGPMHDALEANPVSASLMSADISILVYTHYLTLMSEVISFCEKVIFPSIADVITDTDSRKKLPYIHDDLKKLHLYAATNELPLFYPVDKNFSVPFALGYMYVIEGSTLGGRMILKHIQSKLGFDENNGASFFAGYGADTGVKWKTFLAALTAYAIANNAEQEIIHGAQHAFASIDRYFTK